MSDYVSIWTHSRSDYPKHRIVAKKQMSNPPIKFIRHQHMNLPESPLFATYPMVEYYHYSDAMEENARLKAEVERLTNLNFEYMNKGKSHQDWIDGKDFTK